MNYKKLITPLVVFALVSWTSLILVILRIEPCLTYSATTFCEQTSIPALAFIYISLFFALTSTFTLIGYLSRIYFNNNEVFAAHFNISLRQGLLLTFCILSCIILFTLEILNLITTLIIFGFTILIELYFLNQTYSPKTNFSPKESKEYDEDF